MIDTEYLESLEIGSTIYFTGYGTIEEQRIVRITTDKTEDHFESYYYFRRADGTTECVSYDEQGKTFFLTLEDALINLGIIKACCCSKEGHKCGSGQCACHKEVTE